MGGVLASLASPGQAPDESGWDDWGAPDGDWGSPPEDPGTYDKWGSPEQSDADENWTSSQGEELRKTAAQQKAPNQDENWTSSQGEEWLRKTGAQHKKPKQSSWDA